MASRKRAKRRVNPVIPPSPSPSQPRPVATAPLRAQGSNANPRELKPEPEPETCPEPRTAAESSAAHISTPLESTSSWHTSTTDHRDLERIIKGELGGATFEENDFITKWFPKMKHRSQNTLVNAVLSKLAKMDKSDEQGVSHKNLSFQPHPFDASKQFHTWNSSKSGAPHYKPFVWLLNSILSLANEHRMEKGPNRENAIQGGSLHRNLRFHVYGLEMQEGLDGSEPLKPNGIGTHGPIETGTKVSWRDVEIAIEVKGAWGNLIAQGSMYARCLFAARETRLFALLVAFNHQIFQVRFCFFRRDGLWASKALDLRQEDGFKTFICAVAGLLSWSTLSEAGMDTFRSDRQFFIADRYLDITHVLCNQRSVQGRATRVYKVRTTLKPTKSNVEGQITTSDATPSPVEQPTHLRSRARTEPTSADSSQQPAITQPMPSLLVAMRHPNVVETPQSVEPGSNGDPASIPPDGTSMEGGIPKWYIQSRSEHWALSRLGEVSPSRIDDPPINRSRDLFVETWKLDVDQLLQLQKCESVIVKESWLTQGHLNEGTMFKCVKNSFGVPRILCDCHFTNVDNHQATFWSVWGMQVTPTIPEPRCLSRAIYLTEGYHICKLDSPRKLVEVLLHAMLGPSCDSCSSDCSSRISMHLGHWVLFKAGWLHRDVSVSNVMAITEEDRSPVMEYVISESSLDPMLTTDAALMCLRISQNALA